MLYEDCSLWPVREVNIPLDIMFKSPAFYSLRSDMNASLTINDVWNSKEDKECLAETLYGGIKYMQRYVWPWFIFWVSARQ